MANFMWFVVDHAMNLFDRIKARLTGEDRAEHLRRGELGERAAEKHLRQLGLKFLTRNFRSKRGEIDLVFRDGDCLTIFPSHTTNRKRIHIVS